LDGAIMPIAEHIPFLEPLLTELGKEPLYADFVEKVRKFRLVQAEHVQEVMLTPREKVIVAAVAAGRTNREIALQISLAEITVKKILSTIYKKYRVSKRSQLLAKLRARKEQLSGQE
jgi:LuxR family transcriptional regulator, maltose regulon positive regulatory protein